MPLHQALKTTLQIAQSMDVSVSLDFEGGYAQDLNALTSNIKVVINAAVTEINLEDQIVSGQGLYTLPEQDDLFTAVRQAAYQKDKALFLGTQIHIFYKHKLQNIIRRCNGPPPLPKEAQMDF